LLKEYGLTNDNEIAEYKRDGYAEGFYVMEMPGANK
jgi:hypothetical protein